MDRSTLHPPRDERCPAGPLPLLDAVLVLGVGVALVAARTRGRPLVASGDGLHYVIPWAELLAGRGYSLGGETQVVMPPGYGLLSLPFQAFVGEPALAGVLTTILAYLGTLLVSASIAHRIRPGSGPVVGLLLAVSPILVTASGGLLSEPTFTFVLLAAASLALDQVLAPAGSRPSVVRTAAIGLLGGTLYLIRPEGALAAFAIPLGALLSERWRERGAGATGRGSGGWRHLALAWALSAAVTLPYILFLRAELGYWTLSGKSAIVLAVGENLSGAAELREAKPELFDPRNRPDVAGYLAEHRGAILRRIPENLLRIGWSLFVNLWYVPLGCLLASLLFARGPRHLDPAKLIREAPRELAPWIAAWILPIVASLPFFLYPRFVMPYLPAFAIAAVVVLLGPALVKTEPAGAKRYTVAGLVLGAALVLLSGILPLPNASRQPTSLADALTVRIPAADVQAAGLLFREFVGCPSDSVLIASRDRATFAYTICGLDPWPDVDMVPPDIPLERLVERARATDKRWLVRVARRVDPVAAANFRHPALRPIANTADGRIALYEVRLERAP